MALKSDLKFLFSAQQAEFLGDSQDAFITALGNASQANAYQIIASINYITVVTAGNNSLKLPLVSTYKNSYCILRNDDAGDDANVYPNTDDIINTLAANAAITLTHGTAMIFFKINANRWITLS